MGWRVSVKKKAQGRHESEYRRDEQNGNKLLVHFELLRLRKQHYSGSGLFQKCRPITLSWGQFRLVDIKNI